MTVVSPDASMSFPKLSPEGEQGLGLRGWDSEACPTRADGDSINSLPGPGRQDVTGDGSLCQPFCFPRNEQATGMSRTLCQGAPKPPGSAAPSLVTWSRAKVGPWTVPGVLRSHGSQENRIPWEPYLKVLTPHPGTCTPAFRLLQLGSKARGRKGITGSRMGCCTAVCDFFRPLKKGVLSPRRGPFHWPLEFHLCQEAGWERWAPCKRWGPRAGPP